MQLRKMVGRTGAGAFLKRIGPVGRPTKPVQPAPRRSVTGRDVLLISHCDFTGNSAYHVHSIARELARQGWSPAVAVPGSPRGARELGPVDFPIVSFRDVRRGRLRSVDFVHSWTPREPVRRLTLELGVPYVVHLEDNESAVREAVRMPADASAEEGFIAGAAGATVVIERLLELVPEGMPSAVVWPGYDERLDRPGRSRDEIRRDVGVRDDDLLVVYTGNVHEANVAEVRELYAAVEQLRRDGRPIVLVKSGWNSVPRSALPPLGAGLRDLGWIRRDRVLELIRAADVLVQPGAPGPFNDYRFPSKLPDYLASGNPVVLPRTNVGLQLASSDAELLGRGGAASIAAGIARLGDDAVRARALGDGGRRFARAQLRWDAAAAAVASVYRMGTDTIREVSGNDARERA